MDAHLLDAPPPGDNITDYDRRHFKTYARLLDADAARADWREVARIVLGLDPASQPDVAERVHRAHLDRALWMAREGHQQLG